MIVTSDVFKNNNRKVFSIDLIGNEHVDKIVLEELKKHECLIYLDELICRDHSEEELCNFIEENLNLDYLYNVDFISVYTVSLKNI